MKTKLLTPARIGVLLLAGFLFGILLKSIGWADSSSPTHKHRTNHSKGVAHHSSKKKSHHRMAKVSHNSKAIHRMVSAHKPAASKMALETYSHPEGQYQLKYPKGWQIDSKDNAMIVKSADMNGDRGVFGIVRRPDDQPNEDAVSREFSAENKPADLVQMPARLAGLQATKVVGSSKEDPNTSLVEYYVKNPEGHQYYVLLRAPRNDWKHYSVAFNTMLNSLSFN